MFLHFMAVGDALISMHGLPTDTRGAMKQRLSAFQRMGFPRSHRLRTRAQLSIDDALKIVFAFQLLEVGMSPSRATRVTEDDWELIRDAIVVAWTAMATREPDVPAQELLIAPHALAHFGAKDPDAGGPLSETLGLQERTSPPVRGGKGAFSSLRIDVGIMVEAFGDALAATGFSPKPDFVRAMQLFADSTGVELKPSPTEKQATHSRV